MFGQKEKAIVQTDSAPADVDNYTIELHQWHKPNVVVKDSDDNVVYSGITHSTIAPHLQLDRARDNGGQIASAVFSNWNHRIDLTLHDKTIVMNEKGWVRNKHIFTASNGQQLTWKGDGHMGWNFKCVDEHDGTVARIVSKGFFNQSTTIEVSPDFGEELLVSAVVKYVSEDRDRTFAAAGAAAS